MHQTGILLTFSSSPLTIIAVPIIVFALLLFVLLAFAGVVLLSLALRYRAGTARRQARLLGGQPECVDDQLLGCFLSFIHVFAFLLGRLSVSIRPDWYGLWRHSWLARADDYPLGKPTGRTFLHAEPLARTSRHVGDCRTFRLRLVARYALRQQFSWRSALADHRLRHAAFRGSRCRIDRLLSGLLRWSAFARRAPRATTIQLMN